MPNWCDNRLTLTGSTESIKKIADAKLSFMALVPPPDGEWDYDWCSENWGTKWDPDFASLAVTDLGGDESKIDVTFASAWSPPIEAIATICAEHNLQGHLEYIEDGMRFLGVAEFIGQRHVNHIESFHSSGGLRALAELMGNGLALDHVESWLEWEQDVG